MANSSGNFIGCQPSSYGFLRFFLSVSFSIGFVLNCISLWIFWFKIKQWNSTVVLQFNLAISDALITPTIPLIIIFSLTDHWTFGVFSCQLTVFLLSTHLYGSIYFLTLISIHRYVSVAHNVKRKALTAKAFIVKLCLGVWGILMCLGLPFFFVLKTSEVNGATKCLNFFQAEQAGLFFVLNSVILFFGALIPFSITIVCYSLLIRYIVKLNPMTTLSKAMVSKSVQTILISLIIFIVCYIPYHLSRTVGVTIMLFYPSSCSWLEGAELANFITWVMSGTNCCLDPILYCYTTDTFKSTFTNLCIFLRRKSHRNAVDLTHDDEAEEPEGDQDPIPPLATNTTDAGLRD
ncbi:P2Y purinoceptor 4-like [Hyperolius riggenbachi]|uniref:P2Y purinoceptor 4-like n=1 Tax=Hyperolius riggenbachi TaxID=752182 RepID=UPI0035A31B50